MLASIKKDLMAASMMDERDFDPTSFNNIKGSLNQLQSALDNIRTWQPGNRDANNMTTHSSYLSSVEQTRNALAAHLRPALRPDPGNIPESLRQAQQALTEVLERKDEVEGVLNSLKSASVKEANFEVSQYFENAAVHHHTSAQRHLIAAGVLGGLLTVGVILLFFAFPPATTSAVELVRHTVGRVTVLLVGAAAIAFCTRNYRVNKHLEVMNRTRYNILLTAGLYVAGVTDEARNLVVAELVRSIFSPGDTGYMSTDREQTIIENPGSLVGLVTPSSR